MAVDSTRWHDGAVAQSSVFGSTLLVQGAEPLLAERAVAARVAQARREHPDANEANRCMEEAESGQAIGSA